MALLLALVVAALYAAGLYLMLRRSAVKLVIGLGLLAHATNLLVFGAAGLVRGTPPVIAENATQLEAPFADPIPHALVLTAIVIGFGLQAFTIVLLRRVLESTGTDDLDELRSTEAGP